MRNVISYFAQRSFLARVMTIMVFAIGLASMNIIKLQELPEIAFPEVEIITHYPGASPQDIELNITNKIEKELRGVQNIREMTSESSEGTSLILLEVDESADIAEVVRKIQQAVDRVSGLPKDISDPPLVLQESTSSFEVLRFGVTSESSYSELQQYARGLEKKIRAIPGIGTATMSGFREREFWVEVDPSKVRRYQLTFSDVTQAIDNRNLSKSGGVVESWQSEHRIVTLTQVTNVEELEQLVITVLPGGAMVRLKDIATVSDAFEKATEYGMINNHPAILFNITKSANADVRVAIDSVLGLLDAEKERLDGKFDFHTSLNLAKDMDDKFSIVTTNGGLGLLLVLIVLSLILKRQVAFWVAVSIPFCVFGVVAMLPGLGMTLDSITFAALLLVIGIIVDDSVIIAESIYRQKELGAPPLEAAIEGTIKVYKPIVASLTTTVLVFIPMFFVPGEFGMQVAVIPMTVILALIFSLFECTFTLPAHLADSLSKEKKQTKTIISFEAITARYADWLVTTINNKKKVLLASSLILVLGGGLLTSLKVDFFPAQAAKYIEVHTEVKPGTPMDKIRNAHAELERVISAMPPEELVSYEMTYSTPVSIGLINLTNFEQRGRSADQIADDLSAKLSDLDSVPFVKFTVDAGGPPPGEPVEVRVIGHNQAARDNAVSLVAEWLNNHPALDKVTHNEALQDQQLQIIPQYEWLARYGLTVSDLASTLRIAFDGETISTTWIGDEEVGLRVILLEQYRNLDELRNTKIYTADGNQVPLSRLANVKYVEAPRLVLHFNGDRQVLVTAQITDDSLTPDDITEELGAALAGKIDSSITLDIGGEAETTEETMGGIVVAFPAAILGIYFVLAIMFCSLLQPLLVISVIPFAMTASITALFLHMQPLSLFALIGVLGMCGVVVNNALVLISQINQKREEGETTVDAVIIASTSRLRPILLTSITTVVGLLPLAYGIGGTDVFMGPMALTLGYGLLFSVPIVLFIIPCLYLCIERAR
ncbi:efflux RND transporter permease subunit [Photobacterium sp. BZF1]|uniref:efflux RND transporter permease subunit n=1 Tax=Photobacterium sp. BZF1 TaxID=1904457 RepID=UPI001653ADBB|nr:efflux RND transporter permease subunit [Photobacterium sp. BZF1]MBC7003919.1 efflux RND transporter permease subunit [Photobacterium sp. BZF1]